MKAWIHLDINENVVTKEDGISVIVDFPVKPNVGEQVIVAASDWEILKEQLTKYIDQYSESFEEELRQYGPAQMVAEWFLLDCQWITNVCHSLGDKEVQLEVTIGMSGSI